MLDYVQKGLSFWVSLVLTLLCCFHPLWAFDFLNGTVSIRYKSGQPKTVHGPVVRSSGAAWTQFWLEEFYDLWIAISGGHTGPQCDARCARQMEICLVYFGLISVIGFLFWDSPEVPSRSTCPTCVWRLHVWVNYSDLAMITACES